MRPYRFAIIACAPLALGACAHGMGTSAAPLASGTLANAAGATLGTVALRAGQGDQLRLSIDVAGMPAGIYGTHIHAVGRCEGPAFATAGMHWNPTMHQHGRLNPAGAHAGDLPNITVGADGRGSLQFDVAGPLSGLLDSDGAAVVVHAHADDERTDPSGSSGDRIACAVLVAG